MNINVPPPAGAVPWEQVRTRLDQSGPFANMYDTPLYRDAVWEQFSEAEYARRYAALRDAKTVEATVDGKPIRFELDDVGAVLDKLDVCVKMYGPKS